MSSPDFAKPGKFRLLWLAALAPLLSGCIDSVGPLYGTSFGHGDLTGKLQAIAIDPIDGRLGHYLVDDLVVALNGTGAQVPAKYHLIIKLTEASQTPLIDTVTGLATGATVVTTAEYRLVPVAGPEPVLKGKVYVAASYDRTSNRYSDLRVARDAEIRNARTLSDQIHIQVASDLATRS